MNGIEMLERMEMISPEFVEEAEKPFRRAGKPAQGKIIFFYAAGMAAGFVLMLLSVGMLIINGNLGTNAGTMNEWAATAIGANGSMSIILLILSAVVTGLFAFLIIRRKKRD